MNNNVCLHGQLKRSCQICDQIAEIESLKAELAEAQRDAARYRWLRDKDPKDCCVQCGYDGIELRVGEVLDYYIDAAMEGKS